MEWLLPVYFTIVHWSQRNVRIRGAALGRIISNVHIVLYTAFSCLPLTVPIRFPFHLGESIFLCSCVFIICLCCCIPVSQISYPSVLSCFRPLALLASAGCQLWCDRGCRAQDAVFPFQLWYPQSLQSLLARTNDWRKGLLLLCFSFVRNISCWKCIQELCGGGICSVQLLYSEDKVTGVIWNAENLVKFGSFQWHGKNQLN